MKWPLHIYRDYLEKMASYERADGLRNDRYLQGFSAGFKSALVALDTHVLPCDCSICQNKKEREESCNESLEL